MKKWTVKDLLEFLQDKLKHNELRETDMVHARQFHPDETGGPFNLNVTDVDLERGFGIDKVILK